MDFLKMNFTEMFEAKHGKQIYNSICDIIKSETTATIDNTYIELVFKISLLTFWGLDDITIKRVLEKESKFENVEISNIKKVHKKSIKKITSYIKSSVDDITK